MVSLRRSPFYLFAQKHVVVLRESSESVPETFFPGASGGGRREAPADRRP